jgi:hypothetical protein
MAQNDVRCGLLRQDIADDRAVNGLIVIPIQSLPVDGRPIVGRLFFRKFGRENRQI